MSDKDKLWGWFDTRPLIWLHYVLLAGGVFVVHELTDITGYEMAAITNGGIYWLYLLLFYAIGLGVIDQIIHKVLRVD